MKIFFIYFAILMIMLSSWMNDATAQQMPTVTPVSDRTPQVRDAIVAAAGVAADRVTEAHLAAITSLNLSLKNIKALKAGDFDGLNNLTRLYLSSNELSTLPFGIFDNLTKLTALELHGNRLSTLFSNIFDNLTQLTALWLHSNRLSTLPSGIFDNLTKLTDLYLHYNELSTLPSGIFDNLTKLTQLYLNDNELSTLPSGIFDNLTKLQWLYLNKNELSTLPSGVFDNLTQLLWLSLYDNKLSTLPSGVFDNLTQLRALVLRVNKLSTLSGGIFDNLTKLRILYLNDNKLSTLPDGIFAGLTELTRLWLHGNAVDPLPLPMSLKAVGNGAFKAVAPTGTPFDIVLPVVVSNGSLTTGATTVRIHKGQVESEGLTVKRTPGTSGAVTVNIGVLPRIPTDVSYNEPNHQGYALVKSGTLPLVIIGGVDPPPSTNNPPVFTEGTSTTRTIAENTAAGIHIGSAVSATDANGDTLTYTLSGTDAAAFEIDNTTGQLKTRATLDYETKATYTVTITASDGSLTDTITVTINVTDIDEDPSNRAPVFTEGASTTRTIAENTAAGIHIGSAVSATDANDDTLTYTLSGTDATAFEIDNTTGQLKTSAALNAAIKSVYSITVTVSDDVHTDTISVTINVTDVEMPPVLDVNSDDVVDITDLVTVAASFGATVEPTTPNPADVNDDGVVDLTDLLLVIGGMESTAGVAAAPVLSKANLHHWIMEAKRQVLGDAIFAKGIAVLEQLLDAAHPTPKKTLLLPNYPNPFNPETWIPYHLATDAAVVVTIYDVRGSLVRELRLGHQPAGVYESRGHAAYWDGRNASGEPVASGLYFYSLTADDFNATRKMLIAK
jgi:Leucine-rich repeat (LRR) protein